LVFDFAVANIELLIEKKIVDPRPLVVDTQERVVTAEDRKNGEPRGLVDLVQVRVIKGGQGQGQGRVLDQDPQEGHGLTTEKGPDQDQDLEIIIIERIDLSTLEDQGHTHPDQGRVHGQDQDQGQGQGQGLVQGHQGHPQALFQGNLNHREFIFASSNDVQTTQLVKTKNLIIDGCNFKFCGNSLAAGDSPMVNM